ncbi:MAG: bifunctional 4-hydroxy-2-oxoglutarate aldolase/2-dehydro-3-deoxy-phosphogluconate aldolase [Acidimicrobiales bacterium]
MTGPKLDLRGARVVVIRTGNRAAAVDMARAVVDGGLTAVEITSTVPGAADLVAELANELGDGAVIGAGTVVTRAQAAAFVAAGAAFVVSPYLDRHVVDIAHARGTPAVPGVMSPTEVATAVDLGVNTVKLFPAATVGPNHLRAIRSVITDVDVVPTGGIEPDDVVGWLRAGATAVGLGGAFNRAHRRGGYATVVDEAKRLCDHVAVHDHVHEGETT